MDSLIYYLYSRACLVSSIKNAKEDSNYKTSIKLIATNLIANSKLNGKFPIRIRFQFMNKMIFI